MFPDGMQLRWAWDAVSLTHAHGRCDCTGASTCLDRVRTVAAGTERPRLECVKDSQIYIIITSFQPCQTWIAAENDTRRRQRHSRKGTQFPFSEGIPPERPRPAGGVPSGVCATGRIRLPARRRSTTSSQPSLCGPPGSGPSPCMHRGGARSCVCPPCSAQPCPKGGCAGV